MLHSVTNPNIPRQTCETTILLPPYKLNLWTFHLSTSRYRFTSIESTRPSSKTLAINTGWVCFRVSNDKERGALRVEWSRQRWIPKECTQWIWSSRGKYRGSDAFRILNTPGSRLHLVHVGKRWQVACSIARNQSVKAFVVAIRVPAPLDTRVCVQTRVSFRGCGRGYPGK